jgi:hypothetical protein
MQNLCGVVALSSVNAGGISDRRVHGVVFC